MNQSNKSVQEFLTNWVINFLDKNWDIVNITQDAQGCYSYFKHHNKVSKKHFLEELKEDFELVSWVISEIMEHSLEGYDSNPYCISSKNVEKDGDIPIYFYKFDDIYIKYFPTIIDKFYWDGWVWEYCDPSEITKNNGNEVFSKEDMINAMLFAYDNFSSNFSRNEIEFRCQLYVNNLK